MEILESSWGVLEAVWSCVGSIVAKFESTQVGQNKPIRLRSNELEGGARYTARSE